MQSHSNVSENEKHQVSLFNPAEVSQFLHNPNFNELSDNDGSPHNNDHNESQDDELARSIKQRFELTHVADSDPNNDGNMRHIFLNDSSLDESNGNGEGESTQTTETTNDDTYSNFIHSVYNQSGSHHQSGETPSSSMRTRFFNGTRFSLFEKPKPYFEYNKLRMQKEEEEEDDDKSESNEENEEDYDSDENEVAETTEYRDLSNLANLCSKLPPISASNLPTINDVVAAINYDESSDAAAGSDSEDNSNPWTENDYQQAVYNSEPSSSVTSGSLPISSPSDSNPSVNFTNNNPDEPSNNSEQEIPPQIKAEPHEVSGKSNGSSKTSSTSSTTTSSNQFLFKDKNCANKILEGLNTLRLSKTMYDIILVVEDDEFHAHRCVLASLSDYFNAMFSGDLSESKQTHVKISSVDANTMKLVVDYAYTSELNITDHNVQAVLTAANLFNIQPLKEACSRYMEWQMEEFNCIGILSFADAHDCSELKKAASKFILTSFTKVVTYDEFIHLPQSKLVEMINNDDLNVPNEEVVFNACLKWLNTDKENRIGEFHKVLEKIRLPLLDPYFIYDTVQSEESLKSCENCQALIQEALIYNLLKDRRNQLQNDRTRSRKSFTHLEALVIIGGEDDSVVLRSVDAYFPSIDRWFPLQCSPYALSKHGIVSAEGLMLYMAGGEWPDQNPNETFWQFNSILDEWKELKCLLTPRSELGLAIVDGYIYAVGGSNGFENLSTVERYDPMLNAWKYCTDMKYAVTSPAVCALNGLLYVIGGTCLSEKTDEQESTNYHQVFNPKSDTWSELANVRTARSGCGSCAVNNKIYLIGGWESSSSFLNTVECYQPLADRWEACPSMISMRFKPGVSVLNNKIYVCGGETLFNYYHDSIESYDVEMRQWSFVTIMSSGRSWLSSTTLRLQNPLVDDPEEATSKQPFPKVFHFEKIEND